MSEFSRFPPAVPDYSRSGPMARGVDQLSWTIQAWVRLPAMSTSCPRRFATVSKGLRV